MCNAHNPSALLVPITLIFLTIPVVVATRPPTVVRALIFAGQLKVAYSTISRHRFLIGDPYHDYIGGSSFGVFLLIAFDWYFLQPDPLRDGTRKEGDRQFARDMPLWRRIWWAANLVGCLRGIGWSNTVPHVVKVPATETRRSFVVRRLSDAVFFIFVMDIAAIYLKHNPITSSLAAERIQPSAQGPIFQILSSLFYMANFWADSQLAYCLLSAVAVSCGFSAPQSWPPLWGSWWDAFTVRRLWGRTWHHFMRRFICSMGKATCRIFGAQPGTSSSAYIQLYVGFFISGLAHAAGDVNINKPFGATFWFFMSQAFAITVEDDVIALARKAGIRESAATRALGRLYVAAWLYLSMPMMTNPILSSGRPIVSCLPFSPFTMVWRAVGMEGKWTMEWPHSDSI
ncbi:membrane bound O-acyl transferase family-domain-containing protein [Schizophyllum commune]